MTRKEAEMLARQAATLQALGFTLEEAQQLRRISMTLHRWYEHECNGDIQIDETSGKAYWRDGTTPTADRETGAKKRLAAILKARNERYIPHGALSAYIQTDPRGAALYIIRSEDVPNGADVSAYYSRGICVS
jgi:hypothetical protein